MKTTIKTISLVGILLFAQSVFIFDIKAANKKGNEPENYCLAISGKVLKHEKKLREKVKVYLIHNNSYIDSVITSTNVVFSFLLKKNQEYSIKIIEPGFANRLISISTRVPETIKNNLQFQFHFDLIPFNPSSELSIKSDILDFPIALIYYNHKKGYFDYYRKYTEKIKNVYKQPVIEF